MFNFKQFMFDKSLTQNYLGKIIGEQQSVVSLLVNNHRKPLKRHLDALVGAFGADTIDQYTIPDDAYAPQQTTATIVPFEVIEEAKAEIIEAESIPVLPPEVASKIGCDIQEYVRENGDELESINPSQLLSKADLAEKVLKASMMPTFMPDDIVFVRFLPKETKIIDGNTYYLDLKSHPTMIRKVKIEGDLLRLVAQHPDYADIIITPADIINVARIVGLLRMTFADYYAEVDAIRKRKDEQIESLIQQIDKAGEREARLISIIEQKHK